MTMMIREIEAIELELAARKLVEGTDIPWFKCIKHCGREFHKPPLFITPRRYFKLALGIVEGKPAFKDDFLFNYQGERCKIVSRMDNSLQWESGDTKHPIYGMPLETWSWNPPKPKTVMVELTVDDVLDEIKEYERSHTTTMRIGRRVEACRKALENLK